MKNSVRVCAVVLACLLGTSAFAQDHGGQELIEKVVVRNRLYGVGGRFEAGASVGFVLLPRLTDHINLNALLSYNISDAFGIELRGGWAYTRQTGLARQIRDHAFTNTAQVIEEDMADLWEMKFNGAVGVRWAPIYGKINLMAELPVHFQAYVWLGGGAGAFQRESVIYCTGVSGGECSGYLQETKTTGLATGALGFRFFTHRHGAVRLEVRDYMFPDSYRVGVDRTQARAGLETGTPAATPGFTNLAMVDLGYTFIF